MKDTIIGTAGTTTTTALTIIQTNQVFQLIELIITIIIGVVTLFNFIYKWWKKAKADKKITHDEIDELIDGINDIANNKNKED